MHSFLVINIDIFSTTEFLFRSGRQIVLRILRLARKFTNQRMTKLKWTLSNVMAGDAVQFVKTLLERRHFRILITLNRLGSLQVLILATRTTSSISCNLIVAIRNKWRAQRPHFSKDLMGTNHIFEHMHVNTTMAV